LLNSGANPHETEYHYYTALDYALFRGHHKVEKLLREQGVQSVSESESREIPHRGIRLTSENQETLVSDAVIRGVEIVLQSSNVFLRSRNGTNCASCHHGSLASMAGSLARDRGMNVKQSTLDRIFQREYARRLTKLNGLYQRLATFFPAPSATFVGYLLWGWSMQGIEPDGVTKVLVWQLLETQQEDGRWEDWSLRPPMTGGDQMATALVIRALKSYPLAGRGIEIQDRLTRAREWLENNPASTLTLKAFRLLGMAWAGTIESALSKAADELILMQKEDGGWAQLQGMESDAWATGLTLIALHHAGMTVSHAVYQRGMEYLLNTQFDDGSWFVRSRSNPVQPHHDSHFPFGWDQWVSHAGTSMACASLALALKPIKIQNKQPDKIEPAYPSNEYFEPNAKAVRSIDFKEDIFPILQNSCSDCHTGQHPKGSFSMRDRPSFLRGGISSLPTVIPGNNHQGQLLRHVTDQIEDLEMPPLGKRNKYPALTPEEVKKLEVWIIEGAFWPEDVVLE
jgi:mono/diheme cytochrome c family protein